LPLANQVRLVLQTAAYWVLLAVRDAIPKTPPLAIAQFKTLQMRLIQIAARNIETATQVCIAFAAACPEAELFSGLVHRFLPPDRDWRGLRPASATSRSPQHLQYSI